MNRLTEALESVKRGQASPGGDLTDKCGRLERQLQDATHKIATQEVKVCNQCFSYNASYITKYRSCLLVFN